MPSLLCKLEENCQKWRKLFYEQLSSNFWLVVNVIRAGDKCMLWLALHYAASILSCDVLWTGSGLQWCGKYTQSQRHECLILCNKCHSGTSQHEKPQHLQREPASFGAMPSLWLSSLFPFFSHCITAFYVCEDQVHVTVNIGHWWGQCQEQDRSTVSKHLRGMARNRLGNWHYTNTHTQIYTIAHHESLKAHSLLHSLSYESYEVQIWEPGCEAASEKEISLSLRKTQLGGSPETPRQCFWNTTAPQLAWGAAVLGNR